MIHHVYVVTIHPFGTGGVVLGVYADEEAAEEAAEIVGGSVWMRTLEYNEEVKV